MKCPKCDAHIGAFKALSTKAGNITCDACETRLRVEGGTKFVVLPLIAFFFFPFYLFPSGSPWLLPVTLIAVVVVYYAAFRLFVRVVVASDKESRKTRDHN